MSGIAQYSAAGGRRAALPISEFSIWLTVCLATVTGVIVALANSNADTRSLSLSVFVLGAGAMFSLGLADVARGGELSFARGLMVAGVLWALSALGASPASLAYSVGRVSQWGVDVAIAYLLLSYPSGRLTGRPERALILAAALLVGLLFVPTAVFGQFPHPAPWSACTSGCPTNAFSLGGSTPALLADVVAPVRELLAVALFAAIAAVLIRRARNTGPVLGQLYVPIAALAILQAVLFAIYFPLRAIAPGSASMSVVSWIFVLSLPAVGLTAGTGRLYHHLQTAGVLERLAHNLKASSSTAEVRLALADALQDPSLQILHSFPGDALAWIDESGFPASLAHFHPPDQVTQVSSGKWRIAILHDASLTASRDLVFTAGSYALAALENSCLTDELQCALRDLAESRARRLTAEHDTRQRIERDLHDGAQQRLVALRLKLGLAAGVLAGRDPDGAEMLHALERDVDATIDEVRSLARGIYPPLLARTGVREALRAVSREAALPTTVSAEGLKRYPAEIETTVYFSCCEALQNAAKHARGATRVTISVWQDHALHFEVRDDGAGFDLPTTPFGTGLRNLSERLAAVGGKITIQSDPGQGTVLGGSIPLR